MYFYDLHCHTLQSPDSPAKLEAIIKMAKKRGLDGIAITDHNKLHRGPFEMDGIDIIPGSEITLKGGGHLLAYFIDREIPAGLELENAVSMIKKQGGHAVLAHPTREEHGWAKDKKGSELEKGLSLVDGLETGNASDTKEKRDTALGLKRVRHFLTAGSDSHMSGQVGFAAAKTKEKLNRENFKEAMESSEVIVRREAEKFRKEAHRWKRFFTFMGRIFRINESQKAKIFFHKLVIRNYFRLRNPGFSRIEFSYKD